MTTVEAARSKIHFILITAMQSNRPDASSSLLFGSRFEKGRYCRTLTPDNARLHR